mmetsp:Transcript_25777/g.70849  ORF Transcript_25777/g.70849 Transcript_25777/m.70849 type:complete len:372 (-) Transcript_25777:524-1639(-)|eukprot:CAMPEP_0172370774 /NCGR_PEP_ID=MMETSP1060-20121228/39580_1 /TAXON_ID=37318 /ORGANISM="Pseudo-nitzschia pungens, Strain cf. cingulata" /LENGTH=371 /DNA_ID=CAMNT_0013096161 /DNA_START=221 /DNA_END=1336 /DNA_ORIENTATION=-
MKRIARPTILAAVAAILGLVTSPVADGFALTTPRTAVSITGSGIAGNSRKSQPFFVEPRTPSTILTTSLSATNDDKATASDKTTPEITKPKKKTLKELRAEGGPFSVNTPIGALNPFAVYYFFVSVGLGIPWFLSCFACQILYKITGNRFDPKRRVPVLFGHCWGMALMRLTRCYPEIENRHLVYDFYKNKVDGEEPKAMFVANHCSWMDIPFLGAVMGWRNYKIVSKKELGIVPILGTALRSGGHIMVDRADRRSAIKTLKQGIQYLKKDGLTLATFPEGTRSRSGRMMDFKAGAFKMAHKAGAPVFPISIVNSDKVMPLGWMMAMRPAYGLAKVVVHPPIPSNDKTEEELVEAVRKSMTEGLPEHQKPL